MATNTLKKLEKCFANQDVTTAKGLISKLNFSDIVEHVVVEQVNDHSFGIKDVKISLFQFAVRTGNVEVVSSLLPFFQKDDAYDIEFEDAAEHEANNNNSDTTDGSSKTSNELDPALNFAIRQSDVSITRLLLDAGGIFHAFIKGSKLLQKVFVGAFLSNEAFQANVEIAKQGNPIKVSKDQDIAQHKNGRIQTEFPRDF
mmetsp:Transcript_7031/g.9720  ORF Transcript_7031/g.9720 Transcript_7031/m.9720 type:complete len:200 (+) Transcript_7031:71-670(+)